MKSSQKLARSVTWLRSVRKVCLIAPLIFLLAACAGTPRYGTGAKQRVGRVYMFRGLIGLLTSGVDKFDRELRAEGFCAAAYEDIQSGFVANQIGRAWKKQLGVDGRRGLRGMRDYFKPWDFPELQISPGPEITSVTCPFHVTNPAIPANPAFRIILPAPRRSISLVWCGDHLACAKRVCDLGS